MSNPYDQFDPANGAKDLATSFAVGSNQLLKMAGDVYGLTTGDMDNVVSKQAQENIDYLQRGKSEKLKAAEARRKQVTDAEEGTLDKAFAYVRETFTDPRLFLSSTAEAAPSMVGAGGIGAGARVATGKILAKKGAEKAAETAAKIGVGTAVGAGAGMQGVSTGADQYQQVVETLQSMPEEQAMQVPQIARLMQEKGATLDEAKTALALDLARSTGLLSAVASVGTQTVPGGRTIEKTLVGGAGRKGAGMALAKRAAGAAVGALGEGVQEAAEEGSGQFATNILARAVEPERELTKGVGEAMGAGFAGAAPLGAAAGAASRPSQSVSEGTQTAGMSDESPASTAISPSLEERPTVDLSKAEDLSQDQFFAAINVRQANLLGGEPNPEDVKIVGEITSRAQVDPEKANAAISAAQEAVSTWSENNENAPTNIRVIYDPGMAQNGYGIRGAFNRRTGEILINAAYATSPEIVEEVARHEWAHQTLTSPEGQKALADFAAQAIPAEELADLSRRYGTQDKMVLVDEWIANNAEKAPGVIARIVQYIREWLSEFTNGAVKLSPQEAANVLLRTLREQQTGRVEAETVREEGTRMSLEKAPVAERRQEAFEDFKAANPRSDAVMEGGRLYSPAVRNRLKNLLSTGEIDRRALDREVERNIPAARGVGIPTEENLPSLEEIRAAVDQSQRSKVGGASNIPAGDSVTVRQDVPAFSRYGVGVVTVQDSKGNKYYQPFVRFTEPVLEPTPGMEKASLKIGAGEAKTPTIVARGKMSEDQSLPADLDTWTQVGYNPDRHSYMYDRETGRPVTGGSEAVQIGNTVFVKDPEFGEKGDFLYSLAQTKTPEFSLEKERTVEDQMKAMTTVKGPLKAGPKGFIPSYITDEEALPTVVAGKNKTISVPFVSYNQYANTYFKSKSKDPNYSGKTVSLAEAHAPVIQSSYSGLNAETYLEKDPIKAADMIVNDMAENLLFLHDLATEVFGADVAKRMSKWYDGARVIAEDLAKKYDVSVSQSAAVLACLSPQKHWFANVSLAENVMDVLKNHQETVFDADVEKAARESIKASTGTLKSKRVLYSIVRDVAGKKLSELSDPDQIAFFTRFLSQYIHPSQAYVVTPEGKLTPGSSVAVAWSGLGVTKNAVAAFLNGSVKNLTAALGGGHKVRNFYGNIRDPNSPLFYTSDTHNVAAALLLPVGGSAFEVAHNFGTNAGKSEENEGTKEKVKGPKLPIVGTKLIGLQGTYAMYVEAGRRAAEQRGILPRQMQSITWETVRILFPDDTKTKELMKEVKGIHAKVKAGDISLAEARNQIVERMGGREGIKARPPEWLNQ